MNIKLPDYSNAKLLIYGDIMLDRYWYGDTNRISPEAPVPVVRIMQQEERPGGAGNVALNTNALGVKTSLYCFCGDDEIANSLEHKLMNAGISPYFQRISDMPTVTKLRILSLHQQLIRLDFEEFYHEKDGHDDLLSQFINDAPTAQAIILSDYGKGVAQNAAAIINAARKVKVPVFVDPKSKDFNDYKNATIITPNLKEFEAVVGVCKDETMLVERAYNLMKTHDLDGLLITRGAKGMTLVTQKEPVLHLPTQAKDVFDVTGAGDTVIATLAASVAAGCSMAEATYIANIAAGIVVGKLGAATATLPEIRQEIEGHLYTDKGIVTEDRLKAIVHEAQKHGEKVVMTNGCFDILHSGHVMYLEQAKALGNRLIVAVNDDDSVRRLKGGDRPINSLERRMQVLSGLSAVDWVVPFSEDTPERVICRILPDVLVKGGDWQVNQIAGADCVIKAGGEVKILGFEEGISTTKIVDKIRKEQKGDK